MLGDILWHVKEKNDGCLRFIFSFMLDICNVNIPTTFIMRSLCFRITNIQIAEFMPQNGHVIWIGYIILEAMNWNK